MTVESFSAEKIEFIAGYFPGLPAIIYIPEFRLNFLISSFGITVNLSILNHSCSFMVNNYYNYLFGVL